MVSEEYLITSLKRIYDECEKAQERGDSVGAAGGISDKYNNVLEEFKDSYPDNKIIQNIEEIEASSRLGQAIEQNSSKLQQMKMNVLTLADCLGVDTEGFRESTQTSGMPIIRLEQTQNVSQSQSVDIQNIIKQIDMLPMKDEEKEELREVVDEYQDELEDDNPDASKLNNLYGKAAEYSEQIALNLGAAALLRGIDIVFV